MQVICFSSAFVTGVYHVLAVRIYDKRSLQYKMLYSIKKNFIDIAKASLYSSKFDTTSIWGYVRYTDFD